MDNQIKRTRFNSPEFLVLKQSCLNELLRLGRWWKQSVLTEHGFSGEVDHNGHANEEANKGIILCTRMLWYFSEADLYLGGDESRESADHIYDYLITHFIDRVHGGVLWELDASGQLIDGRKQIYAQAFAVYALSAYYRCSGNPQALEYARDIYHLIEKYARDKIQGGYLEAFSRDWGEQDDIRLSDKDLPSPKTMNTHLHILEAFTGLLLAERHADQKDTVALEQGLRDLIDVYTTRFYNKTNKHLYMFLSLDWVDESQAISYGHDIESSWLLWEALEVLGDEALKRKLISNVEDLARSCFEEGRENDSSVFDLYHLQSGEYSRERIWWVQAEAMVGFLNAWQLTSKVEYLDCVYTLWDFIQRELINTDSEWHWIAKSDQDDDYREYRVGFWKGPYHNGRALLELCRRIDTF